MLFLLVAASLVMQYPALSDLLLADLPWTAKLRHLLAQSQWWQAALLALGAVLAPWGQCAWQWIDDWLADRLPAGESKLRCNYLTAIGQRIGARII